MAQSLFGLDPNHRLRHKALDLALDHEPKTDYQARLAALVYQSTPETLAAQAPKIAELIATSMQLTPNPHRLSALGEALGSLGERPPAEPAQEVALRLVESMGTTTDPWQLSTLGKALSSLGERLPAKQAQAGALRLLEVMRTTPDPDRLSALGEALGSLGKRLSAEPAQAGALRLVEVMRTTPDPDRLSALGRALSSLGERLPAEPAQAGAARLVEVLKSSITPEAFVSLAGSLGDLPVTKAVTKDAAGIETAPDLLQAPMAFGEIRENLLRYYSRLAGVFETPEQFGTTDDLVAWVHEHRRPSPELTRPPRNPFR